MNFTLIREGFRESAPWLGGGMLLGLAFLSLSTLVGGVLGAFAAVFLAGLYFRDPRPRHRVLFAYGVVAHLVGFYWIFEVIRTFGRFSTIAALGLMGLFTVLSSMQFVAMNFVFRGLASIGFARYGLALPSAWLVAELWIPRLFPWTLGSTQIAFTPLAQVADLSGVSLLSGLLLWWSGLTLEIVFRRGWPDRSGSERMPRSRAGLLLGLTLLMVLAYGQFRIRQIRTLLASAPVLDVALVQGNLDPIRDFVYGKMLTNIKKYRFLSRAALQNGLPDVLIWPESSVGYDYRPRQYAIRNGGPRDPYPGLPVPLIFGGQLRGRDSEDGSNFYFNSAFLLEPSGVFAGVYKKQRLFPFSESLPLASTFPWLRKLVPRNYPLRSGQEERVLDLRIKREPDRTAIPIATLICYEDVWPGLFRQMVSEQGAEVLLALSNDNWFLQTVAPAQHHLLASWRAIELRRFLIRSTNNGLSAIVNPLGETIEALPVFETGVLRSAEVRRFGMRSVFSRLGSAPLSGIAAVLALLSLLGLRKT